MARQLTEINSEITRRGEFKSDLIVLGGALNDALGGFRVCGAFTTDSCFIAKPEALLGTISG